MKVIKVYKSFKSGVKIKYLIFPSEMSDEEIDYKVYDWCDIDPSGSESGYSYKWNVETDKDMIKTVLDSELKRLSNINKKNLETIGSIEKYLKNI